LQAWKAGSFSQLPTPCPAPCTVKTSQEAPARFIFSHIFTERLARGDRKEAEQLYRRALDALDPLRSEHGQLREQIEGSLKELAPRKAAPAKKPAAAKRK
jgi:hypothetical protein